jgi:hypothetical protein
MKGFVKWWRWLLGLRRPVYYYYLDGKPVSEAEWYANGGLEVEEELKEIEEFFKGVKKRGTKGD